MKQFSRSLNKRRNKNQNQQKKKLIKYYEMLIKLLINI